MIQSETEDMLPRAAPKPSAPTHSAAEDAVRPTVPEVSLLFGQQTPTNQQQQQTIISVQPQAQTKQPSYNSWKKQMLPRVSFPASLATELGPGSSSDTTTQLSSACATSNSNTVSSAAASSEYDYDRQPRASALRTQPVETSAPFNGNTNIGYSDTLEQYRRSYTHRFAGSQGIGIVSANRAAPLTQRRSIDVGLMSRSTPDVLTICAGTQTEPVNISPNRGSSRMVSDDVATKEDIAALHGLLQHMREEQLRLLQYCESLFNQQNQQAPKSTPRTCLKDIGTQCELLASNNAPNNLKRATPIAYDYIPEEAHEQQPPKALQQAAGPTYNQLKTATQFQSPRAPPAAQSTAYRPNTPQAKRLPLAPANVATVLPKPNTEKSLVMNELALKYLPQEKLAELMQELRMSTPANNELPPQPMTPLRQIENYDKSPNDISNASYKYLKKYRLLPEEHIGYVQQGAPSPQRHELQQSPLSSRKSQSPYQQQRTNSPLIGGNRGSPVLRFEQNMLDLENIRNQPKLL